MLGGPVHTISRSMAVLVWFWPFSSMAVLDLPQHTYAVKKNLITEARSTHIVAEDKGTEPSHWRPRT